MKVSLKKRIISLLMAFSLLFGLASPAMALSNDDLREAVAQAALCGLDTKMEDFAARDLPQY